MKVGDYVRFENGVIGKILDIDEPKRVGKLINIEDSYIYYKERDIKKSSPNIIDLIEIGDYVNGEKVEDVETFINDRPEEETRIYTNSKMLYNEDIKSIVTKEQFESMGYKINE